MDQLYDAMLVVISGCSALYCYMLGRRLRSLHNLKKGMGRAVAHMTQSIGSVETHATKLNRETTTTVAQLGAMLAKVDAYEQKIDVVLGTMDKQARETWKEYQHRSREATQDVDAASAELNELVHDAKALATLMNQQILAMAEVADRQKSLLEAMIRAEQREEAAKADAVEQRTVAQVREAAETRRTGTDNVPLPAISALTQAASSPKVSARVAGSGATRQWANAAAAAAGGDKPAPSPERVAEIAQRLGLDAPKPAQRRANPFVRDAVKKAETE